MTIIDNKAFWHEILESVKVSVSPAIFSTWFTQTHLIGLEEQGERFFVQVGCYSSYVKTTIENRYFGLVQDSLAKSLGKPCDIVFIVKQNPEGTLKEKSQPIPLFEEKKDEESLSCFLKAKVKPGFNFANYAVSTSNQMAWAAAEAVAQNPGNAYNPLFIWGGVGVGKTHLMNAIGATILDKNLEAKIYFCSGEEFTNDIVEGIRNKTTQSFRNKYRKLDCLFIDDIQFLAGKDAVQEEFFHTFNAVTGAGGQIVLTSDRPPSEIAKLEERLRSRFEAGLIVDISQPDFELRCAIIQIKTKERGIDLPMETVQLIAANIDSARKIEGFLIKLITEAKLKNMEVTTELVQSLLGKGVEDLSKNVRANPNEVVSAVAKYFSVGKKALLGQSRARPIALPRQILMYLLRTHLQLPLEEVGRVVGGRDHTTVMHAVAKISQILTSDVQIRQDILGIKNSI